MIKIFLIERQKIVREGIKVLLEEESDFQVFTCENKDVKISLLNRIEPDLILVSLDRLDEEDFSYLNILLDLNKNRDRLIDNCLFKIVVYADRVNEFILNKALSIGCQGYLLKESSIDELKQAVRSIHRGYKHIGNNVFSQIKQLSIASNHTTFESDIAMNRGSYQTGLQTVSNIDSDEFDYADLKLNSSTLSVSQEQSNNLAQIEFTRDRLPDRSKKRWQEISWIILSVALGCMTGISAAWAYGGRDRSLSLMTKYGTIGSNTIAIKTPHAGKIERVNYQVGDLVSTNDVVVQIEPKSVQSQRDAIAKEIEQIEQQIESEKQLLASEIARLKPKQLQLQQLLTSKVDEQNKSIANLPSQLNSLDRRATEAYQNYQSLRQLSEQNIVSKSELTRAKQNWLSAKRELTQIRNQQPTLQIVRQLKTEQLQEKIDSWQSKINERKKAIARLEPSLADLENRWQNANSKLSDLQAIELKAPLRGIIQQIAHSPDRVIAKDETVFNLLSCQNLWVEVALNGENLRQIDWEQPVTFRPAKYHHNLTGNISSIEPLIKSNNATLNLPYYKTSISHSHPSEETVEDEIMFKIIVNFPLLENYMHQQEFCGVGDTGLITFNN